MKVSTIHNDIAKRIEYIFDHKCYAVGLIHQWKDEVAAQYPGITAEGERCYIVEKNYPDSHHMGDTNERVSRAPTKDDISDASKNA
jgi:hypothetical protein